MNRVFSSLYDIAIKNYPNRQNSVIAVNEFSNRNGPSLSPPRQKMFVQRTMIFGWKSYIATGSRKNIPGIFLFGISFRKTIERLKNIDVSCFFHRHLPVLKLIKSEGGPRY